MNNFSKIFVTMFGIGFIPFAPGTVSSIVTIIIWLFVTLFLNIIYFYALFIIVLLTSFYLTNIYLKNTKKKDPSEVVIDEFLGQSIPLLFLIEYSLFEVLIAFVAFRLFDIFKIYPISKVENLKGSYGVILDDILAGIYSLSFIMVYKIILTI